MGPAPSRSLFHVDSRTWVAVLAIGVGFGSVGSLGLAAVHQEPRALICLVLPIVFAYTAATLERPGPLLRPRVAMAGNVALVAAAIVLVALALGPVFRRGIGDTHPLLLAATGMSVLLQVAVIVVGVESIGRLRGIIRGHGATRHVIRGKAA